MKTMIDSIAKVVEFLGGVHTVSNLLHITPQCVKIWLQEGFIPTGFHLELYLLLEEAGGKVDLQKVFGLSTKTTGKRLSEEVRA